MRKQRHNYSPSEKVAILKKHVDVCIQIEQKSLAGAPAHRAVSGAGKADEGKPDRRGRSALYFPVGIRFPATLSQDCIRA